MRIWCDGAHDPAENMRRDMILLGAAEQGAEATLRLFAFAPQGITLGASQDPSRAIDLDACRRDGIPWAVRPTGGRAIFHAEEWTYSLAAPIDDPEWGGSLTVAYGRVTALLVAALRRLGVPAEAATRREPPAARGAAAPCFASATRHEVAVAGRKLVGSAQRRTARGILQQGSLLLDDGHLRLADYLPGDEASRSRAREALAAASVSAGRWLGPERPLGRWADALAAVLGTRARPVSTADAPFRLTLPETRSYTRVLSQVQR